MDRMKNYLIFMAITLGLALTFSLPAEAGDPYADIILYNGKIITVDKNFSIADAVAIKDGKFIGVGKKEDLIRYLGYETQRMDLEGKTVIPGLIDSHNHMMRAGVSLLKDVQLNHCKTMNDVLTAIGEKAKSLNPGEWVVTSGQWHESQLVEKRLPTGKELDSVSPNNPVYVARGGHTTVVNSMAFKIAGITKDTPNPPGGEFKRDPITGDLTGLLFERPAQSMIQKFLPKTTHDEVIEGIKLAMKEYNSYGIVGVSEPGVYVGPSSYRPYYELWSKGALTVRVRLLLRATKPEQVENFSTYLYQGFGDNMLRISGIKLLLDGGVETAFLKEPYQIVPGEQEKEAYHGVQVLSTEALIACCREAARQGWHIETHAVGDAAIDLLVDTYEKVNREFPIQDLRWAVMHIFLPTQQSINKMKELGISATVQDHPTYLGANQVKYWGEKRGSFAIPNRKLLDEGIMLGGGTDAPVVHYDPFLSLWWMVTRNTVTAGILGADQGITREEALRLYTINSAYFTFEEEIRGSIESGKLADLVILDNDILKCPADDIKNIRPLKTMMGGKFVFEVN